MASLMLHCSCYRLDCAFALVGSHARADTAWSHDVLTAEVQEQLQIKWVSSVQE